MTADPKKNTEIKDEDLDQVAGGGGNDVDKERPDAPVGTEKPESGGKDTWKV